MLFPLACGGVGINSTGDTDSYLSPGQPAGRGDRAGLGDLTVERQ